MLKNDDASLKDADATFALGKQKNWPTPTASGARFTKVNATCLFHLSLPIKNASIRCRNDVIFLRNRIIGVLFALSLAGVTFAGDATRGAYVSRKNGPWQWRIDSGSLAA